MSNLTLKSENRSSGCVSFVAFVLAVSFLLTLPLALLAFDVGQVLFNPPLVKRAATDELVNSDLLPVALEWFSSRRAQQRAQKGEARTGIDEPDIVLLMSFLDRTDWRDIRQEVLASDIVAELVSVTVDGVYAWIDSDDRLPQITWNLRRFKDRVNSEHGVKSILIAYDKLSPCVREQIDDFKARLAAAPPGTKVLYNLCEFPDPWHEDQFNDYVNALHKVVANTPDQFAFTQEVAQMINLTGPAPDIIKQQLRLIRFLMQWVWVVPLAELLLILSMAVRSLRGLSRWWGLPLLIGGSLALLLALADQSLSTRLYAAWPFSAIPDLVKPEAFRAMDRLIASVSQPMLIQAAVVVLLGLGLIMSSFLVRSRHASPR
jgi:hypothetical protein